MSWTRPRHRAKGGRRRLGLLLARGSLLLVALAALVSPAAAYHGEREHLTSKEVANQIGVDQRMGNQVPLDLSFRDEAGRSVRLGDLLEGTEPVILTLNYYKCPSFCPVLLEGLVGSLRLVKLEPGAQYKVVTVGLDPREAPADAVATRDKVLNTAAQEGPQPSEGQARLDARLAKLREGGAWRVLTGDRASVERLAQAVGVRYTYDQQNDQYAHPAVMTILTPAGKVSRYFFGLTFPPRDVQFGLMESSVEKIGSVVEQLLLKCFKYDPVTGQYTNVALGSLRLAGLATIALLGGYVFVMVRRDVRRSRDTVSGEAV
jgi:protein SCO1/2